MYENYLVHYGRIGMRWGHRQNEKKENERTKKKLTTGQKAAIIGGTAVLLSVGAYFVTKHYQMNADAVIKKGKEFQHMGRKGEDLLQTFYASYLKSDNKIYEKNDFFGSNWKTKKTLVSSKDIKIAGTKMSLDVFTKWVQSSPTVREKFPDFNPKDRQQVRSSFYKFNRLLSSPDIRDKAIFKDFYSSLADKGYDAIRDMNDQVQSGARSPIIVFNNLSNIMTTKVKDLG